MLPNLWGRSGWGVKVVEGAEAGAEVAVMMGVKVVEQCRGDGGAAGLIIL
jgi:hypothetical protein